MGGGPDHQELLITLPLPKPEAKVLEIQRRFPHIKVTWLQVSKKDEKEDELKDLYKTTTIIVTLSVLPDDVDEAPHLKLIHLFSAGLDHLLTHPLFTSSDIPITTSSGIHGPPIAEYVLSSLLSLTRHTFLIHSWQKAHEWGASPTLPGGKQKFAVLFSGGDWVGKTVGIAGYGGIGRQVARVLMGLGCNVHVYTASARTTEQQRRDNGWIVGQGTALEGVLGDREGVLPKAWYSAESGGGGGKTGLHTFLGSGLSALVIALPLTKQTEGLLGKEEFQILKDGVKEATREANPDNTAEVEAAGCYLVNIARGKIVKQDELIEALNEGVLKGAAIDVTDPEPLDEQSGLWDAKNCIVTPHVSGLGREYTGRAIDVLMGNLERLEKGDGLINEVRRARGY